MNLRVLCPCIAALCLLACAATPTKSCAPCATGLVCDQASAQCVLPCSISAPFACGGAVASYCGGQHCAACPLGFVNCDGLGGCECPAACVDQTCSVTPLEAGMPPLSDAPSTPKPDSPRPMQDRALRCDGVDDEVRLTLSGVLPLSSWTMELWVKVDSHLPVGSPPQPVVYAPSNDFFDTFSLRLADWTQGKDRRLRFSSQKRLESCSGTAQSASPAAESLSLGLWHHVAAMVEIDEQHRVRQTYYVDGKRALGGVVRWLAHEFPCHELTELVVCGAAHRFDKISPFLGAIDSVKLSQGIRYREDFTPKLLVADGQTILFLSFNALPLEVEGAAADKTQVSVQGDPLLAPR